MSLKLCPWIRAGTAMTGRIGVPQGSLEKLRSALEGWGMGHIFFLLSHLISIWEPFSIDTIQVYVGRCKRNKLANSGAKRGQNSKGSSSPVTFQTRNRCSENHLVTLWVKIMMIISNVSLPLILKYCVSQHLPTWHLDMQQWTLPRYVDSGTAGLMNE